MTAARAVPKPLFDIDVAIRARLDRRMEIDRRIAEMLAEDIVLVAQVDELLDLRTVRLFVEAHASLPEDEVTDGD